VESCDVLIVGGGPAGATCAWALQRAGLDVAVLDQAQFPRDKVCAGWITPPVLTTLEIDPQDYGRDRVLQPITGFRIGLMGRPPADVRYPKTVSYGIRRCEFDDYLLRRSGARLFTGEPVRSLRREAETWLVDDRFRTPMLVGAGGHTCPVARALGAHPGGEPAVTAQEIEFLLPEDAAAACAVRGEQPELYFCKDLAGYGWCFRKGDYLNIGLGRDDREGLAPQVDDFLTFLCRERGVTRPPGRLHGHAYLLYGRGRRNLLADGAVLVGDAAGMAYPQSGEGIRPAVESGLLAAWTIIEAQGDYRAARLAPYLSRLKKRFGPGGSIDAVIPAWVRALFARGLFSNPRLLRRFVLDQRFLRMTQETLAQSPPAANPCNVRTVL
jgi:geranylgeranyl reductase family protein